MKKSIAFLLASLATTSSLLFNTQEAKAGTIIDQCTNSYSSRLVVFKKNNAGNFVVKYKYGNVLYESNSKSTSKPTEIPIELKENYFKNDGLMSVSLSIGDDDGMMEEEDDMGINNLGNKNTLLGLIQG